MKTKAHPEFEHAAKRLRKAARDVADAEPHELIGALKHLGHTQNDWHNAIPRDHMMRPLPGVLG